MARTYEDDSAVEERPTIQLSPDEIAALEAEKASLIDGMRDRARMHSDVKRVRGEGTALDDIFPRSMQDPTVFADQVERQLAQPGSVLAASVSINFSLIDPMELAQLAETAKAAELKAAALELEAGDARRQAGQAREAFLAYLQQ